MKSFLAILILTAGLGGLAFSATPALSLGSGSGLPGTTTPLPGQISAAAGVVALQYDVLYEGGRLAATAVTPGNALLGHTLHLSRLSDRSSRVVVYSLSNLSLQDGILANLYFAIASNAPVGTVAITLTNGILADATAKAIPTVSYLPGTLTIRAGPARLGEITRSVDGLVRFDLVGSSNGEYQIETSTDLVTWQFLGVGTATGGVIHWLDSTAKANPNRFYRAVAKP